MHIISPKPHQNCQGMYKGRSPQIVQNLF